MALTLTEAAIFWPMASAKRADKLWVKQRKFVKAGPLGCLPLSETRSRRANESSRKPPEKEAELGIFLYCVGAISSWPSPHTRTHTQS